MLDLADVFKVCLEVYHFCRESSEARCVQYCADFERSLLDASQNFPRPDDLQLLRRAYLDRLPVTRLALESGLPRRSVARHLEENISIAGSALMLRHLFPPSWYFEPEGGQIGLEKAAIRGITGK